MQLIILALVLVTLALIVVPFLRVGTPPMPTSNQAKSAIEDALPPSLTGQIFELGTGWGGLARRLGRHLPGCTVTGYEISPLPWLYSRVILAFTGPDNLSLRYGSFASAPLAEATAVVCYLSPQLMAELAPRLKEELRPGTWVVSNAFAIPGWTPLTEVRLKDMHATAVFLYRA